MDDPAEVLTSRWAAMFCPFIGYNRRTKVVTPKGKSNGLYKHNIKWIRRCLEEGYTFDEIAHILSQAKNAGGEVKFVNSLMPLPKRDTIFLDPSQTYIHPDLHDENGNLIERMSASDLVLHLLRRCKIATEDDPAIEFFKKKETGTLFYLLDNFSLDEILYMADVCYNKGEELKSLIGLPNFIKEARKKKEQMTDFKASVLNTLKYTRG